MDMSNIVAETRLFRIGVTGENREGAIDLLGKDDAREFVRHCKSGEGDFLFGASAEGGGEAFGVTAQENELARAAVAQVAEPASKLLRGELLSGSVEQDDGRA